MRHIARHKSLLHWVTKNTITFINCIKIATVSGRCAIAHCAKRYRVPLPVAQECRFHWAGHVLQQLGFKPSGYAIWGPRRSESTTAGSLTTLISWSMAWGDRAGVACTDQCPQLRIMETSFAVCRVSGIMADTLNIRFTNSLYCNISVVTDVVFKYFLAYSTTFFAIYQPGLDVLIHVAPCSVLASFSCIVASWPQYVIHSMKNSMSVIRNTTVSVSWTSSAAVKGYYLLKCLAIC